MKKEIYIQNNMRKVFIITLLAFATIGLVGCGSNNGSTETQKAVELKEGELSEEETKALKEGDTLAADQKVNHELLERLGLDCAYVYDTYTEDYEGDKIKNSDRTFSSHEAFDPMVDSGEPDHYKYYYNLKNLLIVPFEFVKTSKGEYKKLIVHENGYQELIDVIDESNIDKNNVRTVNVNE